MKKADYVDMAIAMLQRPRPRSSRDLSLCTYESTYLGHLFYAEQPGQLQAQHLEAGLGRLEGNNGCQSPGLTQSSAMALGASGQWVSKLLL